MAGPEEPKRRCRCPVQARNFLARGIADEASSGGDHHGQRRKYQPPFTEGSDLKQTRRCARSSGKAESQPKAKKTAVDPVPGKEEEGSKPRAQAISSLRLWVFMDGLSVPAVSR